VSFRPDAGTPALDDAWPCHDRDVSDASSVWLLWHGDDIEDDTPDAKLLGIYSSEERARDRIERSRAVDGFMDYPDAFAVARYDIDKDEWTGGFVTIGPDEVRGMRERGS
jgi:hypothetical protein